MNENSSRRDVEALGASSPADVRVGGSHRSRPRNAVRHWLLMPHGTGEAALFLGGLVAATALVSSLSKQLDYAELHPAFYLLLFPSLLILAALALRARVAESYVLSPAVRRVIIGSFLVLLPVAVAFVSLAALLQGDARFVGFQALRSDLLFNIYLMAEALAVLWVVLQSAVLFGPGVSGLRKVQEMRKELLALLDRELQGKLDVAGDTRLRELIPRLHQAVIALPQLPDPEAESVTATWIKELELMEQRSRGAPLGQPFDSSFDLKRVYERLRGTPKEPRDD